MSLFCRHEWEMIEDTCHLYRGGLSKEAVFRCSKCDKVKWFDIFEVPKNKYVFHEYTKGEISDGSHTFNELYHHRMVLFSIICNANSSVAWKSWKHDDGTMYKDYFIVGIDTPKGQYSYHYHKSNWDRFHVKELERAPKWDGHEPNDIDRLLSLYRED